MSALPTTLLNLLSGDALIVAPRLLGWELTTSVGGVRTSGVIVETEAYRGLADPASHTFRGPTPRTRPMFEGAGTVYVYLSYGIHRCCNLVTGRIGDGQAVLIRALEPRIGVDTMALRRRTTSPHLLTSGPGRLAEALGISLADSGTILGQQISLEAPEATDQRGSIVATARVGIRNARDRPWRFYIAGNPHVTRPK